jgi:hypothetical protein
MNSLFGVELPTPVNFLIAFVVVLVLIGAAAWLVRRLGATRLEAASRGRQPRLAVIDSAAVDSRRKLVIIRRDNVEHLLMIGGPSDVVVETNIIRAAAAAAREAAPARTNGNGEHAPRPLPLPDPDVWPQLPEPAATATHPAPIMRGPRPTTDDAHQWQSPRSTSTLSAASTASEPVASTSSLRAPRQPDTIAGLATDLASGGRTEAIPAPPPAPPAPSPPPIAPSADQSLAEMAQRLEAALRRPAPAKMAMESGSKSYSRPDPIVAPSVAPKSTPQPKSAPITAPTSLEKEMANLLGRPGKT